MQARLTRREALRIAPASVVALASAQTSTSQGDSEITVRVTAGSKRFAEQAALRWQPDRGPSSQSITVDPSKSYQEMLGFGAALTDAACYMFNQLPPARREELFHTLFHPSAMSLSVCRICIGSSDYATRPYSFDEGEPDPKLQRFSIDHDREYIIPILKQARNVNPELFLLASPWSPPGWMKANNSMLGGCIRKRYFPVYARYFSKFLQAYAEAGVPVNAVTVQNEVDTDQDGRMPASLWGQEYEMEFVAAHLGPQLKKDGINAKIWILDHNYNLWGRAICELDDPEVNRYVDGIAWHGYVGEPSAMTRVHDAHPGKHAYWTEGGPDIQSRRYATDWAEWSATFTGILRNWARCIIGWNLALDEAGKPNIGPFSCGGIVTINSQSKEITQSGMYAAFSHYSRAVRRGARRIASDGDLQSVSHTAFVNPDQTQVTILTNSGDQKSVALRSSGKQTQVNLPSDSITTLTWRS
ncbi:MAG: hypothetical protein JO097_18705 [Acidobacteriaceae bacterium]|nr:hypothetical protein [Acidobacteriaceae bacterium]MBV9294300.1 hypothetical protein [Acidobacteriaceae bacterium]MBV9767469.1 hypothetical protein [Acidobacteriaceae bacterium]